MVVHLDIAMILADCFLDALDTKAMLMRIRFTGSQAPLGIFKGILPAGVDSCYYSKWGLCPFGGIYFYESIQNV